MRSGWWSAVPFAGMVVVEFITVILIMLCKAAMLRGMNNFIFIMYSSALCTLILLFFFFFHRATLPPVTFSLLCKLFLLGLIGILVQIFSYTGLNYNSPMLTSAMSNVLPAFTFILAIIFRPDSHLFSSQSNWVIGGVFFSADCLLTACRYIIQAPIVKQYPHALGLVFLGSIITTIQSALICLIAVRDPSAWRLRPDLEMIAIVYSAVLGYTLAGAVLVWCVRNKGPFYISMFIIPLRIVIAVMLGVIFLGETLHTGSVIGSIIIALGFYAVIWGKAQEEELVDSGASVPILQGNKLEEA